MKKFGKRFVNSIFILLIMFAGIGSLFAKSNKKTVVRIGSSSGEGRPFSGLVAIAIDKNFIAEELKKVGYEPEYHTFGNGIAVNEAIISNELDISVLGDVPAVTGFSNKIGSVWLGLNVASNNISVITRKGTNIKSPKDFYGKTVSVNIGTASQYTYEKLIEFYHLDKNKFETVNLSVENGIAGFLSGDVDIVFGLSSQLLPVVANGEADLFFDSADRPDWSYQLMLVGRKKFLDKNPKAIVAFFKAIIRAREEFKKAPEDYYNILAQGTLKENKELGKKLYDFDGGKFENLKPEITTKNIEKAQGLYDLLKSLGRTKGDFKVSTAVQKQFYTQALEELQAEGLIISN